MEKVLFIVLKHQIDLGMEAMEHLMEMEEMEDLVLYFRGRIREVLNILEMVLPVQMAGFTSNTVEIYKKENAS